MNNEEVVEPEAIAEKKTTQPQSALPQSVTDILAQEDAADV